MNLTNKQTVHYGVAVLLLLGLRLFLPVDNGLTESGRTFLCVFLPTAYLWITVDVTLPSIFALALLGLFQVFSSTELYWYSAGNSTVVLTTVSSLIIAPVASAGIMDRLAQWFISRKIVSGRPYLFFLFYDIAVYIAAIFVNCMFAVLIFTPLSKAICHDLGYEQGSGFHTAMLLQSLWISLIGSASVPFAKVIGLTVISLMEGFGIPISYAQYVLVAQPLCIAALFASLLIVRLVIRPDMKQFSSYDPYAVRRHMSEHPLNRRTRILSLGFILLMLLWVLQCFSGFFTLGTYLNTVGAGVTALLVLGILCMIQVDGRPVIQLKEAFTKVPWGVIVFLWMVMLSTSAMSIERFGLRIFLMNVLDPIFHNVSVIPVMCSALALSLIMTNLISNNVTLVIIINVFIPIFLALGSQSTIDTRVFAIVVTVLCSVAFVTPAACPPSAVVIGSELRIGQSLRANLAECVVLFVLGSVTILLF